MKYVAFSFLLLACASCMSSKKLENERAMEAWLEKAEMPVRVYSQTFEFRCAPGFHCYTLVDNSGRVYYAQNVRHDLPRILPEPLRVRARW